MSARPVPRILSTADDFADAAEDMVLPRVDFTGWPDEHVSALADQKRLTCAHDELVRSAARLACLGRVCARLPR